MNWLTFLIAGLFAYTLEVGLRTLLALPDAATGVSPSFLLIVLVYVGLLAPASTVVWASLGLGVLADLMGEPLLHEGPILGPAALGYLAGGYAVVQLRSLVFRESMVTLGVMTFAAGIFVQLVIVMLYQVRGWPITPAEAVAGWSAADQLVNRFLMLLYTAAVAFPVGGLLFRSARLWGFQHKVRNDRVF